MVQPFVRRVKLVAFAQKLARRLVKQPHAFVGTGGEGLNTQQCRDHGNFHLHGKLEGLRGNGNAGKAGLTDPNASSLRSESPE